MNKLGKIIILIKNNKKYNIFTYWFFINILEIWDINYYYKNNFKSGNKSKLQASSSINHHQIISYERCKNCIMLQFLPFIWS